MAAGNNASFDTEEDVNLADDDVPGEFNLHAWNLTADAVTAE
jgi:hypothetical protein